jgi:hypothetical protein
MRRQTSLLFFGLFAAGAGAQVAACSSDDSAQPGVDAGSDSGEVDSSAPQCVVGCNCALPVMSVRAANGGQAPPDWSCYTGTNFFFRPLDTDGGDDAAVDASDAGQDANVAIDAGTDSAVPPDASPPEDAGPNPYRLHIDDFSSGQPPVGSTVNIYWGQSTTPATPDFVGAVDDAGMVFFPPPPANTAYLSYRLLASSDEEPIYWQGQPIIPPGKSTLYLGSGQTEGNSVSTTTDETLLTSVFGSETPQRSLASLVSASIDCQGNDVEGAQMSLIDEATGAAVPVGTTSGEPRAFYFINGIPNSRCTYTNNVARGVWTMANAPVNEPGSTHSYVLRMTGRMNETSPATGETIAETPVELYSGGITLALPRKLTGPAPNATSAVPDGG